MTFEEFDPLKAKESTDTEVSLKATRRELSNILDSYVGWYDPFSELIQNALDSIEERAGNGENGYVPTIRIVININDNSLIVTDNGVGLSKEKYKQFLAPSLSFKSGRTRGHKGVGATYLAYGFNFIQISTKTADFSAVGKMTDARKWLNDENPAGNPKIQPDTSGSKDSIFNTFDSGVSIYVKFDKSTHPGDLSWIKADTAEKWLKVLSVKTGLGAFFPNNKIKLILEVVDTNNIKTTLEKTGLSYAWAHELEKKCQPWHILNHKAKELHEAKGPDYRMPSSMSNLDAIYDTISCEELAKIITLDDTESTICLKHKPTIYYCYMYSAKAWQVANEILGLRQGVEIFSPGIQIAANNMPQGEIFEIPLKRYTGRQNQMQVIIHFDNCRGDLGRKGFQKEIVEFSKSIAQKLIEKPIARHLSLLRPITGVRGDFIRQNQTESWKDEIKEHEQKHPLVLNNPNFFLPMKEIAITSEPTREQDVIALFNQLIAGGVIRGIRIMSTNERFTYDGMYRVVFKEPTTNHTYHAETNPLGVDSAYVMNALDKRTEFVTMPRILEYKFSLDALIEDISNGNKNSNDIELVVVWETGSDYKGSYHITSLLDPDNQRERQYHGVTHTITNLTTRQHEMDLIVIKELIDYLNDPAKTIQEQKEKYDEQ